MERVAVGARPDSPLRCALCHDLVGDEGTSCAGCATVFHAECRAEVPRCPTLGCVDETRVVVAPPPAPARSRRGLLAVALALVVLLAGGVYALLAPASGSVFRLTESKPLKAGPGRRAVGVDVLTRLGTTGLRLQGADGELATVELAGWGHAAAHVECYPHRLELELLRLEEVRHPLIGSGPWRAWYGVTPDDRLTLVRLEAGGHAERLVTGESELRPAPPVPDRSPAECCAVLEGRDPVATLEVLQWLGADHLPSVTSDAVRREAAVVAARRDPGVQAAVWTLAPSGDPWIAEAAALALDGVRSARLEGLRSPWRSKQDAGDRAGALEELRRTLDATRPHGVGTRERKVHLTALRARVLLAVCAGDLAAAKMDQEWLAGLEALTTYDRIVRAELRLLAGDRDAGLADLRAVSSLDPSDDYAPLWLAAVTGDTSRLRAVSPDEPWLDVLVDFLAERIGPDELLKKVVRGPGTTSPAARRCVAECFLGLVAEGRGDPDAAAEHYEECVATGQSTWSEFAWASCRLAQRRRP